MIFDARKNGKNENGKPCPLHSGLESRLDAGDENKADLTSRLAALRTENHQEHQKIFEDIKGLAIAVAGAASAAATAAAAASSRKRGKA
jgi:hypothetical protein